MVLHYDDTQIQRIEFPVVIMPLPKKITVENPKINYGLVKKWILFAKGVGR
jgi:hypothetical protein